MALPNKAKIPVGTVLAGKYRITREIGRGGMAAVYEAANVDIGKRVAIKVLAQELTASAVVVERFLREARAAAAIRSPYICDIYDSGRLDDGRPFLVLELLEGESLYERMTKIRWLDIETTTTIVVQTCRGLTKAHAASIVHRDLKPENIFLTKDEDGSLLSKILDFGLAKFYAPMEGAGPQARLTREGAVFGTPAYMSPEQVRGQGAVDHRADLWALGCIVYECFTGRTVWSTEQGVAMTFAQIANAPLPRPAQYRPDLPQTFTTWFDRALDRDITKRFQTAKEFADELVAVLTPDRVIESSSTTRPISQILGGPPSVPSVRVYPPVHGGGAPSPNVAPDAVTEPPPQPSSPVAVQAPPPHTPHAMPPAPPSGPAMIPQGPVSRPMTGGLPSGGFPSGGFGATPPTAPVEPTPSVRGLASPPPAQKRSRALRTVAIIAGGVVLVGGGAAFAWKQLATEPPVRVGTTQSATSSAEPPPDPTAEPTSSAAPTASVSASPRAELQLPPWMPQVREGQQAIAEGRLKDAARLLKEAFDKGGGHGVPRTMLEHVSAALSSGTHAPCHLAGLARPRMFDLATPPPRSVPAGRPSIAVGPRGPVIVWTDAHEGPEHAYTAVLDDALIAHRAAVDVTPEGAGVTYPEIVRVGDKLALSYGDTRGPEAGVHARFIDAEGRIAGPAVAITPVKPGSYQPSIAVAGSSIFVAWTDDAEPDSEDLFLRKLGPTLDPASDIVRATDLAKAARNRPRARHPSIAVGGDALFAAYKMEKDPTRLIQQMRLPLADASKGLGPPGKVHSRTDRTIGEVALVNLDKAKSDGPSIACSSAACFLAWHGEGLGGGASVAYIEHARVKPLWRRKFSRTGTKPAVAFSRSGQAQIVWFEGGRVMTAPLTRDRGVGVPTRIARVSGDQPTPSIVAGSKPGEWYVAWLDYETGHLEAYAARVQCK
jgi:eukaryotic-like serine/threonine-protein kinase